MLCEYFEFVFWIQFRASFLFFFILRLLVDLFLFISEEGIEE